MSLNIYNVVEEGSVRVIATNCGCLIMPLALLYAAGSIGT